MPYGEPQTSPLIGELDQAHAEVRNLRESLEILQRTSWTKHPCTLTLLQMCADDMRDASAEMEKATTTSVLRGANAKWRAAEKTYRLILGLDAQLNQTQETT